MTYDVQRWVPWDRMEPLGPNDTTAPTQYVLASDAEAHEKKAVHNEASKWSFRRRDDIRAAREQAICDCIAAVEALTYGTGMGWLSGEWINRDGTITALRALLEDKPQ